MTKSTILNYKIISLILFISLSITDKAMSADLEYNRFQYGAFGNLIIIKQNSDFKSLPGYPTCSPSINSGNGKGIELGILAEYPIFKLLFAGTRIGYETYETSSIANQSFWFQQNNEAITGLIEHRLETKFTNVFGEFYVGFRPIAGLILNSGIKISLPFSPTFSQKESLKFPSDFGTFENGLRERNVYTDEAIPDIVKPIAIFKLGVSYEFPLNSNGTLRFAPEISYNLPLTPVVGDYDWYLQSLRIGAAVKFSRDEMKPLNVDISALHDIEIQKFQSCDTSYTLIIPNQFTFIPTVEAPAGIRNWEFSLFRGNNVLSNISSSDPIPEKMILPIPSDSNYYSSLNGEYSYNLKVTDKQGKTSESEKHIKVINKMYGLNSNINGYGIDIRDGKRYTKKSIQLLRKISTNVRPLLNYVFFDTKSYQVPSRYNRIEKNETYSFDEHKMHKSNAIEIYHQVLNIVARRMRENPTSSITLNGFVSALPEEISNTQLARSRAIVVRNYLTDVWDIDTSRIQIGISPRPSGLPEVASMPGYENHLIESAEENQRIEIIPHPDHGYLLNPVITTDTLNQVFPLQFVFNPKINSTGQKYNWQLNIAQNEKLFAKYQGDMNLPDSIILNLKNREAEMIDKGGNLHYEFYVQDEFGQQCKNSGEIQVELMKMDSSFYKYSLILFEYESYNIEQKNRQIIDLIKETVVPGSSLSVTGFTDGLGDSISNRMLSKNRALFTAKEIFNDPNISNDEKYPIDNFGSNTIIDNKYYQQLPNNKKITDIKVSVFGVGEDLPLLYDNSTPEGRFYCRTVTVTVVNEQLGNDK